MMGRETASGRFVVVENIPGYLPMDDDPYVADDWRDALRALVELVRRERDYMIDGGADVGGWLDREAGAAYLVDEGRPHDLGLSFEILPCED